MYKRMRNVIVGVGVVSIIGLGLLSNQGNDRSANEINNESETEQNVTTNVTTVDTSGVLVTEEVADFDLAK